MSIVRGSTRTDGIRGKDGATQWVTIAGFDNRKPDQCTKAIILNITEDIK